MKRKQDERQSSCVQTVMTSNDSFKHLKSTNIFSGISRSLVLNGMVDLEMGGQKVHSMGGIHNVLSADEIATFSGQREVRVSDSTCRYIVYGSVTCLKSCYKHRLCIAHNGAYLYKE